MKSVVLLLYSFVLVGCAGGGNRVDPIENLRNSSMTVVEGYSRSVATALAFGDQEGQVIEKAKLAVSASLNLKTAVTPRPEAREAGLAAWFGR